MVKTTRTGLIDRFTWPKAIVKHKIQPNEKCKIDGPIREAERVTTEKRYIDPDVLDDFNAKMAALRTKYPIKSVPAMPTITYDSKTIEAMAGYFKDSDTECPNESDEKLSDCDSEAGDDIDFAEMFQIFLKRHKKN